MSLVDGYRNKIRPNRPAAAPPRVRVGHRSRSGRLAAGALDAARRHLADSLEPAGLHGAAGQALADLGHALEPLEARLPGLGRQRLRAAMGAEAFRAEYAAGRALDPPRAAHQVLYGIQPGREAQRAGTLVREPACAVAGEAVAVLTPRELDVLEFVAGIE
jgi:hypothetical protein